MIRIPALAFVILLGFLRTEAAAAFGDCSATGYFGIFDDRMAGQAIDCREAARFTIETPTGPRQVRIVYGSELPTLDLPVMVREIRRGIEHSAAALRSVGTVATDDITVWISHLLPVPGEEITDVFGGAYTARDGCRLAVYPGMMGRRGLAFTTAHEFFHCVQQAELPDRLLASGSEWWGEGTAEWFANLALQGTGKSDDFVAGFDASSNDTPLTAMDYAAVVFFFWLAESHGNGAVVGMMRAMPTSGAERAQQDALAAFLSPEDWQRFAEAYLAGELRQPGGRPVASSPFPGDIYVWERNRTHTISADRFVLARAQLEFSCGVWSVNQKEAHGTRAMREGPGPWAELPERIVVDEGEPRLFQMAGFGTGSEGFAVTITGTKNPCRGCPGTVASADRVDRCLVGRWELVSGGYGKQIQRGLRETGLFEAISYPHLHRYLTLRADGSYEQGGEAEEGGEAISRTESGKLWQGMFSIAIDTHGYWSVDGDVLHLCEQRPSVDIELTLTDPDGTVSRLRESGGPPAPAPLMRQREFECSASRLSLYERIPHTPVVHWKYRRAR